jgi:hypothetical protein
MKTFNTNKTGYAINFITKIRAREKKRERIRDEQC